MNREDITRMAQEAGFVGMDGDHGALRRFAALVAKHTLLNLDPNSFMSWQEGFEAGKQTEREACAKLCDDYEEWCGPWGQDDNQYAATESAMEIAKAIRARGQA